ncbi:MAG: PDZ domain-containing protein [Fimbriiglobus sp.]|nr:PDZ domain-containing protein [Fimbriiglobus sp.]
MLRTLRTLRWPLLGLLAAAVVAIPSYAQDKPPAAAEKQKQLDDLKKQMEELQKKIAELEKQPIKAESGPSQASVEGALPSDVSSQFKWRNIGPANMGGRVTAIAVNEADPTNYWIATASGGLLKTVNNGITFDHQFDTQATVSIGDVAVSASNPQILYLGTGENNPRNSVTYGDGVYKSTDGGKTWANVGLRKSFQIGKVLIHPKDPNVVYVGAKGRLYGPGGERGVYKTEDGGKTWNRVCFVDDNTGVIDMRMDPTDPNVIIAAFWDHKRDEHDGFFGTPPVPDSYGPVVTHGPGGGLYKTADGGKTWKKLTDEKLKNGLPTVKTGRIGLDYSRKTKGLLFAIIDTEKVGTGTAAAAYFGAVMDPVENKGGAKLTSVTPDSPAAKAGLKDGDIVIKVGDLKITTDDELVNSYAGNKAGDKIKLTILRDKKEQVIEVTLGTRPGEGGPAPTQPVPSVGIMQGRGMAPGVAVGSVTEGGPAEKAGIKEGDLIVEVDGKPVANIQDQRTILATKKEGDKVKVKLKRGEETKELEVTLGAPVAGGGGGGGPQRGQNASKPYGLGLGGQQPNVQGRQGKDGYQTGGVFVSKDNGEKWERVNSLNPRPMYFSQIRVDPTDDNTVYVLCDTPTPIYVSTDGGKRFENLRTAGGVHADAHALWINPKDGRHLIIGCDGGFYVTYDKGAKWDHLNNFALGQFYHVAVDNRKPYRVYGGLQDNGSWGGPSDTLKSTGPVNEDWVYVSGGDGFVCRVNPTDPDEVYTESQGGAISRRNFRTGESAGIRPAPVKEGEQLRFNWNTPFILSSHNPSIFYCGAQYVFRSVKKGADLKPISPDLTRSKAGSMIALGESPRTPDVLWAGTDDGHLWVTKDGGLKWENVTENVKKAGLPGFRCVGSIEPSRDKAGRCYVSFDAHRSNDDKPYLFATDDYGATWKSINSNLPEFGSTRVLREDYVNTSILYCGTEFGAFVSLNKGGSWAKLGAGLPTVACHEFAQPTTAGELVVATHGRSVWVLDINAIRQMSTTVLKTPVTLFTPATATRWRLNPNGRSPYSETDRKFAGENPARGAAIDILVNEKGKKASLKIVDVTGKTVWEYGQGGGGFGGRGGAGGGGRGLGGDTTPRPTVKPLSDPGLHRVRWTFGGGGFGGGGAIKAGVYKVVFTLDDKEYTQPITVELDPNLPKDAVAVEAEEIEVEDEDMDRQEVPVRRDR